MKNGKLQSPPSVSFSFFLSGNFSVRLLVVVTAASELQRYVTEAYILDMSLVATHIELRPNRAGQPRAFIAGTRVRVQDIYALAELQGASPDDVVLALPHLTLGQVYAALSYYFDHRDDILREMREDDEYVRRSRALNGPGPLETLLNARSNKK